MFLDFIIVFFFQSFLSFFNQPQAGGRGLDTDLRSRKAEGQVDQCANNFNEQPYKADPKHNTHNLLENCSYFFFIIYSNL